LPELPSNSLALQTNIKTHEKETKRGEVMETDVAEGRY
jgi:hypothetical protein